MGRSLAAPNQLKLGVIMKFKEMAKYDEMAR